MALVLIFMFVAWWILLWRDDGNPVRSQVSEGRSLAEGAKTAIDGFYVRNHAFPADNREAHIAYPRSITGTYVSSVTIENGTIVVLYGGAANAAITGKALVVQPHSRGRSLQWTCDSTAGTSVPVKYRPSICRP